ncbi:MAG: sigma-70 family RNA polymerase sigma factor [Bacteroidales bacterium]|nr:sigma-70 family RNA polymerase sigma factor [Prevotella sp.]MBR1699543.1 sigma-70 family RNA polymerase sigma factor [Bacteroidales bacterium]
MNKNLEEQELARLCREKNKWAQEELYRRYAARLLSLCRRYTRDLEEAEDLLQDAVIQALDKIETYKYTGKGSLYGWMSRIAVNKAVNQIRRQRWRWLSLDMREQDTVADLSAAEMETIPEEKLLEWIAGLPDLRRAVFNLYCIEGYSHKEIGKMLGISEKGSAGVLAKARKQLKEEIRRYLKET